MSNIITPRRDLILPSKRLQRGSMLLDAYRFTPATSARTALLLHFDDSVSGGLLIDSSPSPTSPGAYGGVATSTSAPKFGTRCLRTAGGAGVLIGDTKIVIGTEDFAYDYWIKADGTSPESIVFDTRSTGGGAGGLFMDIHPSLGLVAVAGGGARYNGTNVTPSTWNHVEFSRTAGTGYMFLGGSLLISWADTANYYSSELFIGGATYYPIGAAACPAYFDEFRLQIGGGGHTSDFTPPTAAYS